MLALKFRDKVKSFLTPLGKSLSFLDPNIITFSSIVLAVLSALSLLYSNFLLAFVFFSLSSFFDVLDGLIAKTNNKRTLFGNYFDAMTDRINEFILFLSLSLIGYPFESFLAFSTSLLVSYAKARAEMIKPLNNIDWPSIGERVERLLILIAMLLFSIFNSSLIPYFLYFLAFICFIGFLQRFYFAYSYLKNQ